MSQDHRRVLLIGATLASDVLGGHSLISQTRGSTTNYFLQDGQGSTRALTSTTGSVTDTYSYAAFGENFNRTGTTTNPYQYTGQQFDSLTGLYDLRARYYNPALGRFLSQDTYPVNVSNPVELNRYGYTGNNPINAMDPTGYTLAEYAINLGRNIAVGAAIGGLVNGSLDLAMQVYTKGPHNIDVKRLLHATLAGAVISAFGAVTSGTLGMLAEGDMLWTIAYGMIDGYYSGLLSRVVMNKLEGHDALAGYSWQTALTDAITGGIMSGIFYGIRSISKSIVKQDGVFLEKNTSIYSRTPFSKAKLDKIINYLKSLGVKVEMGDDIEKLLREEGAGASYIPGEGVPGTVRFASNPSAPEVVEELLHIAQHRKLGWAKLSQLDIIRMEIEANYKLLQIGKRLQWSPDEMYVTGQNLYYWIRQWKYWSQK